MFKVKNYLDKFSRISRLHSNYTFSLKTSSLFKFQRNYHSDTLLQEAQKQHQLREEIFKFMKVKEFPQQLTPEQKLTFKKFQIFRFDPSGGQEEYTSYYIDLKDCGPMILDALVKIKDTIDPTLSFRR